MGRDSGGMKMGGNEKEIQNILQRTQTLCYYRDRTGQDKYYRIDRFDLIRTGTIFIHHML